MDEIYIDAYKKAMQYWKIREKAYFNRILKTGNSKEIEKYLLSNKFHFEQPQLIDYIRHEKVDI